MTEDEWNTILRARDYLRERDEARAEVERLHKLFTDAESKARRQQVAFDELLAAAETVVSAERPPSLRSVLGPILNPLRAAILKAREATK